MTPFTVRAASGAVNGTRRHLANEVVGPLGVRYPARGAAPASILLPTIRSMECFHAGYARAAHCRPVGQRNPTTTDAAARRLVTAPAGPLPRLDPPELPVGHLVFDRRPRRRPG